MTASPRALPKNLSHNPLCSLYNLVNLIRCDIVSWCNENDVAICPISNTGAWDEGNTPRSTQACCVDLSGDLLLRRERLLGRLLLYKFKLRRYKSAGSGKRARAWGRLTAQKLPLPRTSPTCGWLPKRSCNCLPRYAPISRTFARRFSSRRICWTSYADAHATGCPWYVWLC